MVKIYYVIGLILICGCSASNKAGFYKNPKYTLEDYSNFYMPNSVLDAYDLTNPFYNYGADEYNKDKYYSLYYELCLKNMTVYDGIEGDRLLLADVYDPKLTNNSGIKLPDGFKTQKFGAGDYLMVDLVEANSKELAWRGWIRTDKIKSASTGGRLHFALKEIISNFPVVVNVGE